MGFESILGINKIEQIEPEDIVMPGFFYDLNLDQVVKDIMDKQKLYDLRRYYYEKAQPEDINYRLEVMKDLDNDRVYKSIADFALGMRKAKEYLGNISQSQMEEQKQKWKLDCAFSYVKSVLKLHKELEQESLQSQGFVTFLEWLGAYIQSNGFVELRNSTEQLMSEFNKMTFHIQVKRDRIIINQGTLEEDYCKQLQDTFQKQSEVEHYYQANPFGTIALSALEGAILEVLKKPFAETFGELKEFDGKFHDFIDGMLSDFEVESQFYVAFRLYREEMKEMKYHFCYPKLSEKDFTILEGYDLALARKNAVKKKEVVYNDCIYRKGEQFLVITGPNQGGKTTFARALGQILYFGMTGLMVPASKAVFPMFDSIYTHFATEESMETGAGKLKEELIRVKHLMDKVTRNSFVIINEIFTSATSYDAYIMGKRVIDYFMKADCLGVYVTHIHELTKGDERIVSLVASLLSEESSIRTFKLERRPADGRSFSNTIVEKYHMTYEEIKERLKQ
jgi:DNA mismatch repair ATPase MutS